MKIESMFYIALGTVVDEIEKSDAWAGMSEFAETQEERNRYLRKAIKSKAQGIVIHDQLLNGEGLQ